MIRKVESPILDPDIDPDSTQSSSESGTMWIQIPPGPSRIIQNLQIQTLVNLLFCLSLTGWEMSFPSMHTSLFCIIFLSVCLVNLLFCLSLTGWEMSLPSMHTSLLCIFLSVCVCVCVCVRERERERDSVSS